MYPFWTNYISKMQVIFISSHVQHLLCVHEYVCVYVCTHMHVGRDKGEGMWRAADINTFPFTKSFKLLKDIVVFFLTLKIGLIIKFPNMQIEISHGWLFHWLLRIVSRRNSHGIAITISLCPEGKKEVAMSGSLRVFSHTERWPPWGAGHNQAGPHTCFGNQEVKHRDYRRR